MGCFENTQKFSGLEVDAKFQPGAVSFTTCGAGREPCHRDSIGAVTVGTSPGACALPQSGTLGSRPPVELLSFVPFCQDRRPEWSSGLAKAQPRHRLQPKYIHRKVQNSQINALFTSRRRTTGGTGIRSERDVLQGRTRSLPGYVAKGNEEQPWWAGEQRDVKSGDPPSGNQDGEQGGQAEQGTPRARWGEADNVLLGSGGGAAKSEVGQQGHDPDERTAEKCHADHEHEGGVLEQMGQN